MATLLHNNQPAGHALRISWGLQNSYREMYHQHRLLRMRCPGQLMKGCCQSMGLALPGVWKVT